MSSRLGRFLGESSVVSVPLCNKLEHIHRLCRLLDLGRHTGRPSRVSGGFHHRMWRLETDRGIYAIKQLAPDTDLSDTGVIAHFNVAETIAQKFAGLGIAAQHALRNTQGYLQHIDDVGYLAFAWTDAVAIDKSFISRTHAFKVARLLAQMHQANIRVSGATNTGSEIVPEPRITELIQLAVVRNVQHSRTLNKMLPAIINISRLHRAALAPLNECLVISHGDLDQKNVLWDSQGNPVLIDWESAGLLNPTYEVLLEALDWSGITSRFDHSLYKNFISAYIQAGGLIDEKSIEPAFQSILGEWVDWLLYNVGRTVMCVDEDQRATGAQQIEFALQTIYRLEEILPELKSTPIAPISHINRSITHV